MGARADWGGARLRDKLKQHPIPLVDHLSLNYQANHEYVGFGFSVVPNTGTSSNNSRICVLAGMDSDPK